MKQFIEMSMPKQNKNKIDNVKETRNIPNKNIKQNQSKRKQNENAIQR